MRPSQVAANRVIERQRAEIDLLVEALEEIVDADPWNRGSVARKALARFADGGSQVRCPVCYDEGGPGPLDPCPECNKYGPMPV